MKRTFRGVLLSCLAALLSILLSTCSLTSDEEFEGSFIRLAVGSASRMVAVTTYDVTSLRIEIWDPHGNWMDEFWWEPSQGVTEWLIPVYMAGTHELRVIHNGFADFGEFQEEISVEEVAWVPIEPGIISRVNIVPGMVGIISVGIGGEPGCEPPDWPPPDCPELYGTWGGFVQMPTHPDNPEPFFAWVELTFEPNGVAQMLVFEYQGAPISMDDTGMRGVYMCDGVNIMGLWTEMWWDGAWHPYSFCGDDVWSAPIGGLADPWLIEVDTNSDGFVDAVWELSRL
jgi:hypothetical protein